MLAHNQQFLGGVGDTHHAHHPVVGIGQSDAAHAGRRPAHGPHLAFVEAHGPARAQGQHHFGVGGQQLHVQDPVAFVYSNGVDARRAGPRISLQRSFLHRTLLGAEHKKGIFQVVRVFQAPHVEHRADLVFARDFDEVLNWQALGGLPAFRNFVHLEPEHAAQLGEEQQVLVGRGHEQVLREIVLLARSTPGPQPAPALGAVLVKVGALDVALTAHGNNHGLVGNHVFGRKVAAGVVDGRAAGVAVAVAQLQQLGSDDAALQLFRGQHSLEMINLAH